MPPRKKNEDVSIENEAISEELEDQLREIYGETMSLDEDVDTFFPSGSLVLDSVLSNGKGIPMGKFISIAAESGCGKCVTGDTIVCVDGVYQKIEEGITEYGFVPCKREITNFNGTDTTSHTLKEDTDFTIKIRDQYGIELEMTREHPLLVLRRSLDKEWIRAEDLEIGDTILGQGFVERPAELDTVYYLRGVSLSSQEGSQPNLTCRGADTLHRVETMLRELSYTREESHAPLPISDKSYRVYRYTLQRGDKETLYHLTFSEKETSILAKSMYEPMSYGQLISKIAGLLDTSADIIDDGISFNLPQREVLDSLQRFLSMLGIVGVVSESSLLLDRRNGKKLATLTLPLVQGSKKSLLSLSSSRDDSERDPVFVIDEHTREWLEEKVDSLKLDDSIRAELSGRDLSRKTLKKLYELGVVKEDFSLYEFHRVRGLQEIGRTTTVYDYTIPTSHSFLANGMISHNSSVCLHVARNCCAKGKRCLYIDSETGLNKNQLESFSLLPFVKNGTFVPKRIHTYRELDELFAQCLKDDSLQFIFLDSLSDVAPDELLENNIADLKQPGLDAKYQALFLKKYKNIYNAAGKTVFFVLQNRTKIGLGYGQQTTVQSAGGLAIKYHMDITLEMRKKGDLDRPVPGEEKPIIYGSECQLLSRKNRFAPPLIPSIIQIHFGKGVSNAGALARALLVGGYTKTPTSRTYVVEYEGEEKRLVGKGAYEAWVKDHIAYYKDIVENKLGGIKLLREPKVEEEDEEKGEGG